MGNYGRIEGIECLPGLFREGAVTLSRIVERMVLGMKSFVSVTTACAVFALALAAGAEDGAAASPGDIVSKMASRLAGLDSFGVDVTVDYKLHVDDRHDDMTVNYVLVFKRPDKVSVHMVNPQVEVLFLSDGDRSITYIPPFRQYIEEGAEPDPSVIVSQSGAGPITELMALVGEFVKPQPFEGLMASVTSSRYVGLEAIDGVDCHHLHFTHATGGWDMWVEAGEAPVVRRIALDLEKMLAGLKTRGFEGSLSVEGGLRWSFEAVADGRFAFNAPDGVARVASFEPPHPLEGKPAPQFSLALLDGGTLDLAAAKGNTIVILDFWATWCGPCRQAMPIIEKVAKSFSDRDVKLYAVNVQESPEKIREFLKTHKLDVVVALDSEGETSMQYQADAIPQTVIIGKDGIVKAVHVGVSRDLAKFEEMLMQEVGVLAGG